MCQYVCILYSLCQYVCILYPSPVTYRIQLFLSICGQYHYYSLGNIECYQFISQKIVFAVCALRVTFPYRSLFLVILTSSCLHFLLQRERERERERENTSLENFSYFISCGVFSIKNTYDYFVNLFL